VLKADGRVTVTPPETQEKSWIGGGPKWFLREPNSIGGQGVEGRCKGVLVNQRTRGCDQGMCHLKKGKLAALGRFQKRESGEKHQVLQTGKEQKSGKAVKEMNRQENVNSDRGSTSKSSCDNGGRCQETTLG